MGIVVIPCVRPSVRSERHYGSNSLKILAVNPKFGGMMHSTGRWSRLQFKMAILGQFLHISWNFEISMIGLDQVWGMTLPL